MLGIEDRLYLVEGLVHIVAGKNRRRAGKIKLIYQILLKPFENKCNRYFKAQLDVN